ncbi:MAG TPA: hypothetical protein VGN90_16390 [Pyrinomonadaceae bacterium]|nr:hypothetical protein [Pyrinomonadaceae bacterium]
MNCQSFAEVVSELARDRNPDQLAASERGMALDHLDECAECALRLQDQRALTRGLQEMASEMKSLTAPARVEEQLLRSFRQDRQRSEGRGERSAVSNQQSAVKGRRLEVSVRWNRWVVAAAAVVLMVLGIGGLRRYVNRQSQASIPENNVARSASTTLPAMVEVRSDYKPEKQLPEKVVRKTLRRHLRGLKPADNASQPVLANATVPTGNETRSDTDSEVATHFMPLGYAGPINPQDGGQLVRVELPRSAMLSLGLPVNMDRYGERVKADVLLGPDGLARAIRFVQ